MLSGCLHAVVALGCSCMAGVGAADAAGAGYRRWLGFRGQLVRDASLVRYYTFEEGRGDRTANRAGHGDGVLTTRTNPPYPAAYHEVVDVPRWTAGRWPGKSALRFGGSAQSVGRSHFYFTQTGRFTLEAWLRRHGGGIHGGKLFLVGDGYSHGWFVSTNPWTISFGLGRPGGGVSAVARRALADHVWHHVVATWDRPQLCIYLDGERLAVKPDAGAYTPGPGPRRPPELDLGGLQIGRRLPSGEAYLPFDLDELALYNRALPAADVRQHYQATAPHHSAKDQVAHYLRSEARRRALDRIAIHIPAQTFGYFPRGTPVVASVTIPAKAGLVGRFAASFTLADLSGKVLRREPRALVASPKTDVRVHVAFAPTRCDVYRVRV